MYRRVKVLLYGQAAGELIQDERGFTFRYYPHYVGPPLSLSLPIQDEPIFSPTLHPVFASLAPEGWLRKRYSQIQQRDEHDQLGMLIDNGKNLLGAVQILPMEK